MIRSQEKISNFVGDGSPFPWMDVPPPGSVVVGGNSLDDLAASMTHNNNNKNSLNHHYPKKKVKLEGERIYDEDGYWLRAACVCVKALDDSEGEVLLVSSSGRPESWIIPGGKMKAAEAPEASAVREAMEEAGVVGDLGRCLGSFDNPERKHRTKVFVLRVTHLLEEFEDKDSRKRSWFPVDDAVRLLHPYKPNHCKYLNALKLTKP